MGKWKSTMDSISNINSKSNKQQLELINYQYGYIPWCIDNDREKEAEEYLNKAQKILKQLEQQDYKPSILYAYKAAFIGFEIGLAPYKAPFIGPESLSFANQSKNLNSNNAFSYVQLGHIEFYTPKIFGGSKTNAMQHYLKAVSIMENNEQLSQNWNYLNVLATIVNAYIELEQYDKAKEYCVKTLEIEPNFDWVKNELYPQILKKL